MSKLQRIKSFLFSIISIIGAIILMLYPQIGAAFIMLILSLSLGINGLNTILYYFSMARHMVDGQFILYKGILLLTLGLTMLSVSNVTLQYIMLYLLVVHGFSGLVDLLHSLESKKMKASWKFNFFCGIVNIILSLLCLIFINSSDIMVYIYSFTVICSAVLRLAGSVRRTAMIYIQ